MFINLYVWLKIKIIKNYFGKMRKIWVNIIIMVYFINIRKGCFSKFKWINNHHHFYAKLVLTINIYP